MDEMVVNDLSKGTGYKDVDISKRTESATGRQHERN